MQEAQKHSSAESRMPKSGGRLYCGTPGTTETLHFPCFREKKMKPQRNSLMKMNTQEAVRRSDFFLGFDMDLLHEFGQDLLSP